MLEWTMYAMKVCIENADLVSQQQNQKLKNDASSALSCYGCDSLVSMLQ